MLDAYAADDDADADTEIGGIGSRRPAPASATRPGSAPAAFNDNRSQIPVPERVSALLLARRHDDPIEDWAQRVVRPALDLTGTTPTLLPDLLRAVSRQAGHLAGDPFNALDNNPFIVREWLIVSQVLHAAATSLEQRFEALFQGI